MYSLPKNVYRERIDFSKIKTTVPIPNLIEIQKKSYERFLQMNRLPAEREDAGLQSVFKSVFPISDFRENSSLEFIEYSIGNWECKCGKLPGAAPPAQAVRAAAAHTLVADPYGDREVLCPRCGKRERGARRRLRHLRRHGRAEAEVRRRRVPGARHDLRRAAQGHHPARRLEQGPRDRRQDHPRHQGAGGLLRRHPADDRQRHVHHQRHRARHRRRSCTARRARSSTPRTRRSTSRRSSRTAAPGSSSSTTPRTCCTSASTASASSWRRSSCARSACAAPTRSSGPSTPSTGCYLQDRHARTGRWPTAWSGCAPRKDIDDPGRRAVTVQQGKKITQRRRSRRCSKAGVEAGRGRRRRARGRLRRRRRRRPGDRRGDPRGQRGADAARHLDGAGEERRPRSRSSSPSATRSARSSRPDAEEGPDPDARRGADRDLPPAAAGRSADARQLAVAVREHVLQPAEVRLLARRPAEAQHQARS